MTVAPEGPCGTPACLGCDTTSPGVAACLRTATAAFQAAEAAFKANAPPTQSVTFHVGTSALAFKVTTTEAVTLEVPVTVTSSTDPACMSGATGTLTLKEDPTAEGFNRPVQSNQVVLNICGAANLLQPDPGTAPTARATFSVAG